MATIILEAGESFEHRHDEQGHTELLAGRLMLTREGRTVHLRTGEIMKTPPGVLEQFLNPGPGTATFKC